MLWPSNTDGLIKHKTIIQQLMRATPTILLLLLTLALASAQTCHYSCATCSSSNYYECLTCNANRGSSLQPIFGMCYCDNESDEDESGNCINSSSFNYKSKVMIVLFISLTLLLALVAMLVKSMKYFLYKTLEDVQELSLIVFINMYFPQQFDIFLTYLYRFNISSYTFQNIAEGTLYVILPDSSVATVDAQNIFGKYRLLGKTANFFGNQFTWIIVFICIIVAAVAIRIWRSFLSKNKDMVIIKTELQKVNGSGPEQPSKINQSQADLNNADAVSQHLYQVETKDANEGQCTLFYVINRIYNYIWFNFLIVFFYFSLIQINLNIFTQIANLTFSSNFATTGAFFSAAFLAAEIVILTLLFLKAREEMVKPEWMRDHSYTPTTYLIRTNYKTLTKYFWFVSCLKKILLAMVLTIFYDNPLSSIIAVCVVHTLYLLVAIYCQPYERKYLRVHFYTTECAKLFLFLSLINFTTKYNSTVQLINLTQIFYGLMAFVFGMHLTFMVLSLFVERRVYKYFANKKCCKEDQREYAGKLVGYRSGEKLFIYSRE